MMCLLVVHRAHIHTHTLSQTPPSHNRIAHINDNNSQRKQQPQPQPQQQQQQATFVDGVTRRLGPRPGVLTFLILLTSAGVFQVC
jgi:hypothetical protein